MRGPGCENKGPRAAAGGRSRDRQGKNTNAFSVEPPRLPPGWGGRDLLGSGERLGSVFRARSRVSARRPGAVGERSWEPTRSSVSDRREYVE